MELSSVILDPRAMGMAGHCKVRFFLTLHQGSVRFTKYAKRLAVD